jgi:hypothetical protein
MHRGAKNEWFAIDKSMQLSNWTGRVCVCVCVCLSTGRHVDGYSETLVVVLPSIASARRLARTWGGVTNLSSERSEE